MPPLPFLHLETDPGLGEAAAGEPPVEGESTEEQGWAGPSQEEWEQTQQALSYFAQLEQQRQAEQNGERQPLDPLADDFETRLGAVLDERLAPIQQFTEQTRMGQAEDLALDILADQEAREGEFLLRETSEETPFSSTQFARSIAEEIYPQMAQRFGDGDKAAEAALGQAYKAVRSWEEAVVKAGIERRDNQLSTLTGARREPPAGGAEGTQVSPDGGDEFDVLRRYYPAAV